MNRRNLVMIWIIFSPVVLVVAYPVLQDIRLHGALTRASTAMVIFAALYIAVAISLTIRYLSAPR